LGTYFNLGFHDLKQFADKELKYRQAISIEAARTSGKISEDHFKIVKEGACAALTMGWLAQQLGSPTWLGLYQPGIGTNAAREATADRVTGPYVRYATNHGNAKIDRVEPLR